MTYNDLPAGSSADLIMMSDPYKWPLWPFLPLMRSKPSGGWPERGILAQGSNGVEFYWMPGVSIYEKNMKEAFESAIGYGKDDLQKILDEGWVID